MQRLHFGIAVLGGELVRALDRFLRFNGELVPTDRHGNSLLSFLWFQKRGILCNDDTRVRPALFAKNHLAKQTGDGHSCRLPPRAIDLRWMTGFLRLRSGQAPTRSHTKMAHDLTRPCWGPC